MRRNLKETMLSEEKGSADFPNTTKKQQRGLKIWIHSCINMKYLKKKLSNKKDLIIRTTTFYSEVLLTNLTKP
jgi:hypothetical protein